MLKVEKVLPATRDRLCTVGSDALLLDAARLLGAADRDVVVVCEGSRMVGLVTKTDIVGRIAHCTGFSCRTPVAEVMTRDVRYCHPDDRLQDVWATIREQGLKNIPVVNPDLAPVGVLHARDAVQALLDDARHEEELLREYVACVGYR